MTHPTLLFTDKICEAKQEIEECGGRITHQFTPEVFVAQLPAFLETNSLKISKNHPISSLNYRSELAVNAWYANVELATIQKSPALAESRYWNATPYQAPVYFKNEPEIGISFAEEIKVAKQEELEQLGTPTSLYLVGSVAVGLVLVSGDRGQEIMTEQEQINVIQQVQLGLDFLATAEPKAKVSFIYDIQPVTVSVPPGADPNISGVCERFERGWRDAALQQMGYPEGRKGYQAYVNSLRTNFNTDWAFVAFFTKYPVCHFAYAIWEKIVMHYDNNGWGTDNIHAVFAHETCHIFGAADEYGNCTCENRYGYLGIPNKNCKNCFPTDSKSQVPCLMNRNELTLCEHTRRQIGWDSKLFR